jgi:NADPH-dependent glutamate synthase beta subunit-like oxidoreductase
VSERAPREAGHLPLREARSLTVAALPPTPAPRRIAVVGAGPAGVAAAVALAGRGYAVTLLEAAGAPGGLAAATIPRERLPDSLIAREIEDVLAASGNVTRRTTARLDGQYPLDHIFSEGFDAVLLATGLSRSVELPGASRPRSGVVGALEFLAQVKRGARVWGDVLVLGGGNTTIDAALSAKRAGADSVAIVYRRSFAEMPAWPEERDAAIRAGIHLLILTQPLDYAADAEGRLIGLKVVRTCLVAAADGGRPVPRAIAGTEHVIPAQLVIEAIGQQVGEELRAALPGVSFTRQGLIETREGSFHTRRDGVFAAGDIVNGGTTVVQAVAEGTRAAAEIDSWLRG